MGTKEPTLSVTAKLNGLFLCHLVCGNCILPKITDVGQDQLRSFENHREREFSKCIVDMLLFLLPGFAGDYTGCRAGHRNAGLFAGNPGRSSHYSRRPEPRNPPDVSDA